MQNVFYILKPGYLLVDLFFQLSSFFQLNITTPCRDSKYVLVQPFFALLCDRRCFDLTKKQRWREEGGLQPETEITKQRWKKGGKESVGVGFE